MYPIDKMTNLNVKIQPGLLPAVARSLFDKVPHTFNSTVETSLRQNKVNLAVDAHWCDLSLDTFLWTCTLAWLKFLALGLLLFFIYMKLPLLVVSDNSSLLYNEVWMFFFEPQVWLDVDSVIENTGFQETGASWVSIALQQSSHIYVENSKGKFSII